MKQKQTFTISNDISLRRPCKADFKFLARHMRPMDKRELHATHGGVDAALLERFARSSTCCLTLCARGRVAGLAGIVPGGLPAPCACVWLLTARGVEKYPLGFFKAARAVLTHFLSFYPTLYNYIDLRYPQAVRFALMLGGHTAGHRVYIHGAPFQLFIFRRNQLWEEQ